MLNRKIITELPLSSKMYFSFFGGGTTFYKQLIINMHLTVQFILGLYR